MKNLMKSLMFLAFIIVSLSSYAQTRDVGDFNEVSVSGNVDVILKKASSTSIEFEVFEGNDEDLITEVKGNKLRIKMKNSGIFKWNNSKAEVTVYYTSLKGISASAGSTLESRETLQNNDFEIDASSGARIVAEIDCSNAEIDASSGSTLKLSGSADNVDIDLSSGANLKGYELLTDNADVNSSSGGTVKIHVAKILKARASSGGTIKYKGDANIDKAKKDISGTIRKVG